MSDTPRTDAASFNEYCEWIGEKRELVAADDMRQLERALARYEQAELPEEPPVMSCSLHEGWFRETDYYALRAHAAKVAAERGEAAPGFGGAGEAEHVAWLRYVSQPNKTRIQLCNSDDPGAFKAYRHAAPAALPAGYVRVPKEPTQAMLDAGYLAHSQGRGAKSVWQVMLAARGKEGKT